MQFALDSFLLDAEARQLRPTNLIFYRQQVGKFLAYVAGTGLQQPQEITAHVIRAYLASLQARGLAPASVQSAARAVRAFCNFLVAEGLLPTSPMQRVKLPKADRRRPVAFTPDEVKRLLAAAPCTRDRAILLCLLDSGCRASEFTAWTVGDVNLATGTVHVRQTKSRAEQVVYLGTQARRALLKHLADLPSCLSNS
jgi:site-specific recombinase XerD